MKNRFLSRRVRFFGNVAIMILCAVFFLIPFAFRGARMAVDGIKNDVKDWLPSDFPETKVLDWFRQYFVGDQFVAVSWPNCSEDDPRYRLLLEKLRLETSDGAEVFPGKADPALKDADQELDENDQEAQEIKEAREFGDQYGLHTTGDYHLNWGQEREKWLLGHKGQWYYITRDGDVFAWDGEKNVLNGLAYGIERFFKGTNRATGDLVQKFPKKYYTNPEKLCCRFFKSVLTGPDVLEKLAGENGSLRKGGMKAQDAEIIANQRLTGSLFGPTPSIGFQWDSESFLKELTPKQLENYEKQEHGKELDAAFQNYVTKLVDEEYNGMIYKLRIASSDKQLEHWFNFFYERKLKPPARTTCLLVTLNEPATKDLSRVVGRPVLGKPRGRIQHLAINECKVLESELHLGGPPNDNVAIDEEGTITLIRLVGISTLVGWVLAYLSFRSVKISFMVFFVGGVSAISSLGIVWWGGSTLDAILMTMPSLVYVLGLSGAVHIVNYYREACDEDGPRGAAETAVRHGWFPCVLAAFTTSLGLVSLCASSLVPIQKFGFFAAIGTMVTVILMFTYLPSSLHLWSPRYAPDEDEDKDKIPPKPESKFNLHGLVGRFWDFIGDKVIKHHWVVNTVSIAVMIFFAVGLTKIQTSVQLIKLFDKKAKVLQDYRWLEENLGHLVPMEIVLKVPKNKQMPLGTKLIKDHAGNIDYKATDQRLTLLERLELSKRVRENLEYWFGEERKGIVGNGTGVDTFVTGRWLPPLHVRSGTVRTVTNNFLEENYDSLLETGYVVVDNVDKLRENAAKTRSSLSKKEVERLDKIYPDGWVINAANSVRAIIHPKPGMKDAELWRVSLRLGALKNVDYGQFVSDLKTVIEPIMSAYEYRQRITDTLHQEMKKDEGIEGKILLVGWKTRAKSRRENPIDVLKWNPRKNYSLNEFCWHNENLLRCRQMHTKAQAKDEVLDDDNWEIITDISRFGLLTTPPTDNKRFGAYLLRGQIDASENGLYVWNDPIQSFQKESITGRPEDSEAASNANTDIDQTVIFCESLWALLANRGFTTHPGSRRSVFPLDLSNPKNRETIEKNPKKFWKSMANKYDCIVVINDENPIVDIASISTFSKNYIDATGHVFEVDQRTKEALSLTAEERFAQKKEQFEKVSVTAEYTGIVPIVYKAQRSLLNSLINSIGLAFIMIAVVMMVLLRDWKRKLAFDNTLNYGGGMISMLPNVFPIVVIFGAMGHLGVMVDIGSMMTASVAMGVAVDDTIHFLNWYRKGLYSGMDRPAAIKAAYRKVATAMTQTTLIGGLGLAVFAMSTFTPTQRFGVMMLLLLIAALIGDLIFLPALLAGPLGKLFGIRKPKNGDNPLGNEQGQIEGGLANESEANGTATVNRISANGNGAGKIHTDPLLGLQPDES